MNSKTAGEEPTYLWIHTIFFSCHVSIYVTDLDFVTWSAQLAEFRVFFFAVWFVPAWFFTRLSYILSCCASPMRSVRIVSIRKKPAYKKPFEIFTKNITNVPYLEMIFLPSYVCATIVALQEGGGAEILNYIFTKYLLFLGGGGNFFNHFFCFPGGLTCTFSLVPFKV